MRSMAAISASNCTWGTADVSRAGSQVVSQSHQRLAQPRGFSSRQVMRGAPGMGHPPAPCRRDLVRRRRSTRSVQRRSQVRPRVRRELVHGPAPDAVMRRRRLVDAAVAAVGGDHPGHLSIEVAAAGAAVRLQWRRSLRASQEKHSAQRARESATESTVFTMCRNADFTGT